jgi:AcrR family transcriptional regulator
MTQTESVEISQSDSRLQPLTGTRIFGQGRALALPPRKWPRQARAIVTVDAIVEATAQLLEAGRPTTTNAIAERAGVSIGTLYQYFDDRDAIVAALSRREREALVMAVWDATVVVRGQSLDVGLNIIVRAALAGDARRPRLAAVLDGQEADLPLDADHRTVQAVLRESLAGYFISQRPDMADRMNGLVDDLCAVTRALGDAAKGRGEAIDAPLVSRITSVLTAMIG